MGFSGRPDWRDRPNETTSDSPSRSHAAALLPSFPNPVPPCRDVCARRPRIPDQHGITPIARPHVRQGERGRGCRWVETTAKDANGRRGRNVGSHPPTPLLLTAISAATRPGLDVLVVWIAIGEAEEGGCWWRLIKLDGGSWWLSLKGQPCDTAGSLGPQRGWFRTQAQQQPP